MALQFEVFPFSTELELRSRFQDFMDSEIHQHGSGHFRQSLASKRAQGLMILQTTTYPSREAAEEALQTLCRPQGPAVAVPVKQVIPRVRNQINLLEKRVQAKSLALHREVSEDLPKKRDELIRRGFDRAVKRQKPRKTCKDCDSTINLNYLTVEAPQCPVCGNETLVLTQSLAQQYLHLPKRIEATEAHINELKHEIRALHENGEKDGAFWLVGGNCPNL
ncbi:MAG: hypothetical protein AWU57_348 [Marinobacter sp. T13-3]|nr:MAG: hypothetical protein AWU57_348 [Marinobacter sp. T13-3]